MARPKKSWWKKNREELFKSLFYSALGGIVVAVCLSVQHKPSSQEIGASQRNATMTATAYSSERFSGKTALGHTVKPGLQIAVSRDRKDLLGKKVYIEGYGVKEVLDLMGEGRTNTIDVLVPTENDAKKFGVKQVEVYVIG